MMATQLKVGDRLQAVTHEVTEDKMVEFEKVVWDRGRNSHSDINVAKADGIQRTIASGQNQMAFLHEMMERNFADAWVYGGKISVRYIHPVYGGDKLTATGNVIEVKDEDGRLIERSKLVGLAREVGKQAAHAGIAKKWGT